MADMSSASVAGPTEPAAGADPVRIELAALARATSAPRVEVLMRAGLPSVDPSDRLAAAAARMRREGVGALAVVHDGRLVGILSERDLLRAVADGLSTDATPVADYMRAAPGVVRATDRAADAARAMVHLGARHLPVVSDEEVVGVISVRDLLVAWDVPLELLGDEPW